MSRFRSTGRAAAGAALLVVAVMLLAGLAIASPGKGKGKGKNASAVSVAQYAYGPAGKAYGKTKITICHKGKKTLRVGAPAWKGHKRHGDTLGACR